MARHNELGKIGEKMASLFLQQNGYHVITQNWRYGKSEIDIIATRADYIIFVEVKTRSSQQWGDPSESVSIIKQNRIIEAADYYLKDSMIDKHARFDIISIIRNTKAYSIEHIENAFYPTY